MSELDPRGTQWFSLGTIFLINKPSDMEMHILRDKISNFIRSQNWMIQRKHYSGDFSLKLFSDRMREGISTGQMLIC